MIIRLTFATGPTLPAAALRFAPAGATTWTPAIRDDDVGPIATPDWRAGGRWTKRVEATLATTTLALLFALGVATIAIV